MSGPTIDHQIAAVRISERDASNIARGAAEHDPDTSLAFHKRAKALRAALRTLEAARWRPIAEAPKDRTPVLICLKDPLPYAHDDERQIWSGKQFVARHPGLAEDGFDIGWSFAAPVGHGGFPDEWIAGWRPLPAPPSEGERDGR